MTRQSPSLHNFSLKRNMSAKDMDSFYFCRQELSKVGFECLESSIQQLLSVYHPISHCIRTDRQWGRRCANLPRCWIIDIGERFCQEQITRWMVRRITVPSHTTRPEERVSQFVPYPWTKLIQNLHKVLCEHILVIGIHASISKNNNWPTHHLAYA